jgi:hypothetical protein
MWMIKSHCVHDISTRVADVLALGFAGGNEGRERLVTRRNMACIIDNGEPGVSKSLRNRSLIEAKQEEFQVLSGNLRDWRALRWG